MRGGYHEPEHDHIANRVWHARIHRIYMYRAGHPDIARHLDFRDYLIAHPEDAQEYSRLKEDLAHRYPTDAASYVAGKDRLVKALDRKAKMWRETIEGGRTDEQGSKFAT